MSTELGNNYLKDVLARLREHKVLAERAIAQMSDEDIFKTLDAESNSVALIVKHMAGNMHSRWTDFLTTDGEKPDRNRDSEFVLDANTTRVDVLQWWEKGWACVFAAIEPLQPADLLKTVSIRGQPLTVVEALNRQLAHYPYHVGQIVFLAKHFNSSSWKSLSIPRHR